LLVEPSPNCKENNNGKTKIIYVVPKKHCFHFQQILIFFEDKWNFI